MEPAAIVQPLRRFAVADSVILEPSLPFGNSEVKLKTRQEDSPDDPAVATPALEVLEPLSDAEHEPLTRVHEPHRRRAGPTNASRPGPPRTDCDDPSQHLVGLGHIPTTVLPITLREEPRLASRRLHGNQPMTDHTSTVVDEEKISNLKLRRADELRREPIAWPQRGVHAPSRRAETYRLGAKEEIADFREIRELAPSAVRSGPGPYRLTNTAYPSSHSPSLMRNRASWNSSASSSERKKWTNAPATNRSPGSYARL